MAVSLYGQCADFEEINEIARKFNLPVIEDGAQSFGASYNGKKSCGLTTIGTTSFFPSKPLGGYGDGGAIFTDDDNLALLCEQIRKHGEESRYHHVRVGMNGRLDTIQAAVLLAKLEVFEREVDKRQRIVDRCLETLGNLERLILPNVLPHQRSDFAQFTLRVPERDGFRAHLQTNNIPTAVHYPQPVYRQPAYVVDMKYKLPVSEQASREVVSLPFSPWMIDEEQDRVINAIAQWTRGG